MKWAGRIAALIVALCILFPASLVVLALALGNTGWGMRAIGELVWSLSDRQVDIEGLTGRFPDALRAARIELRDGGRVWAAFDDVTMDWRPRALFHREIVIDSLIAAKAHLSALPHGGASSGGPAIPFAVKVTEWQVRSTAIDPAIAPIPVSLGLSGNAAIGADGTLAATINGHRLDGPGTYRIDATIDAERIAAHAHVSEPEHGPVANLVRLPDLGPLAIDATLDGPRNAERLEATIAAGKLDARAHGTIDLANNTIDLDGSIDAPAMQPRNDIRWRSIMAILHVHGGFAAPEVDSVVRIDRPAAAGATAERIELTAVGDRGEVHVVGTLQETTLPGPAPRLLADAPIELRADAQIATRTLDLAVKHPLLGVSAHATIANIDSIVGTASFKTTELAPFAAAAGIDLFGTGTIGGQFKREGTTTTLAAAGDIAITGGAPPVAKLFGGKVKLNIGLTLQDHMLRVDRASLDAMSVTATASGTMLGDKLDGSWRVALADLSTVASPLIGNVAASGSVGGRIGALSVAASLSGSVGADRVPKGPIEATLDVRGLPDAPEGKAIVKGTLAGAPLNALVAGKRNADGSLRIAIDRAAWKRVEAHGELILARGATLPTGKVGLSAELADIAPLAGVAMRGKISADVESRIQSGRSQIRLVARVQPLELSAAAIAGATIDGSIDDPLGRTPLVSWQASLKGIDVGRATGDADISVKGVLTALAVKLSSRWQESGSANPPATLAAAALVDASAGKIRLDSIDLSLRGERATLLAPARIDAAGRLAVDRLRIGIDQAVLEVTGTMLPKLDLTAALRHVTARLVQPFLPKLNADGTLEAEARLTGTIAAPQGSIRLKGTGLALHAVGPGAVPPATLDLDAKLRGSDAEINGRLTAGQTVHLELTGRAPLDMNGRAALRTQGRVELAMLEPFLAAEGRSARGTLSIDATIAGSLAAPTIDGTAKLVGGELQDYVSGLWVTGIGASLSAENGVIRIVDMKGRAGTGTLSASGTIDLSQHLMPVNLRIGASRARPLQSNLLTADMDAALTLTGQMAGDLTLGGTVRVRRANINIPERFPPNVAVLAIHRPGQAPPPPPRLNLIPTLNLTLNAPEQVFVRGHGLDAEVGGTIAIAGTATQPRVTGALSLRRGTFNLVGQNLRFTSGKVTFDQSSLARKLDPSLYFVAQSSSGGVTATITITGYADDPKIALTSSPQLPSDEIMARILFGKSVTQLTGFQLASVALGVASLTGVGGGSTLGDIRQRLGLDRLAIGSDTKGTGAAIEAGRYVARGVYVGAKQGVSGGTQAQVQIDVTQHIKLESTLGTGNGAPATGITPQNDPGSSVGISYQLEY